MPSFYFVIMPTVVQFYKRFCNPSWSSGQSFNIAPISSHSLTCDLKRPTGLWTAKILSSTLDILKIVVKLYLSYSDLFLDSYGSNDSSPNYYTIGSCLVCIDAFSYCIHAGQGFSYRPPRIRSDSVISPSEESVLFTLPFCSHLCSLNFLFIVWIAIFMNDFQP